MDKSLFQIIKHQHNALYQYLNETKNAANSRHPLISKLLESIESDLEMEGFTPIKPSFGEVTNPETMKLLGTSEPEIDSKRPIYEISETGKSLLYSRPDTVHKLHECGWIYEDENTGESKLIAKATVTIFGKSNLSNREAVFNK